LGITAVIAASITAFSDPSHLAHASFYMHRGFGGRPMVTGGP